MGIERTAEHPVRVLAVAAAAFVVLVVGGIALRNGQDLELARAFNALHTGVVGSVASAVYGIFEPVPSIVLTAVLAVVIWIRTGFRTGVAFAGVVALTWLPTEIVKVVVHRGRPDVQVMPHPFFPVQTDASFPSGHMAFIVALVVALALVVRATRWYPAVVTVGTTVAVLMALALAIDAVHYPTDIVASVVWSLAVAPAARLVWVDWIMPRVPIPALRRAAVAPAALAPATSEGEAPAAPAPATLEGDAPAAGEGPRR